MEQGLAAQPIPAGVIRAAYHYSNWDFSLEEAREGSLTSLFRADKGLPMVSPADIARACAKALMGEPQPGLSHVEGPRRLSPDDVAAAFGRVLSRDVEVNEIPRGEWLDWFKKAGFSDAAAESYVCMTAATADSENRTRDEPIKGATSIDDHIAALMRQE